MRVSALSTNHTLHGPHITKHNMNGEIKGYVRWFCVCGGFCWESRNDRRFVSPGGQRVLLLSCGGTPTCFFNSCLLSPFFISSISRTHQAPHRQRYLLEISAPTSLTGESCSKSNSPFEEVRGQFGQRTPTCGSTTRGSTYNEEGGCLHLAGMAGFPGRVASLRGGATIR